MKSILIAGALLALAACSGDGLRTAMADEATATDATKWQEVERRETNDANGRYIERTKRMAVPGGWIYRVAMAENGKTVGLTMVFVPDPAAQ